MDKTIKKLYQAAPRFDEGEFFSSKEYSAAMKQHHHFYDLLVATFGQQIEPLLEEYTQTLYDMTELETKHFFQEGYHAAQERQNHEESTPAVPLS